MVRSSAASKFVLFGFLISSMSAAPSFADDVIRCFKDDSNPNLRLRGVWVTVHRGTWPNIEDEHILTDDGGCHEFVDVDDNTTVTVLPQNQVVRLDGTNSFTIGHNMDLDVDAGYGPRELTVDFPIDNFLDPPNSTGNGMQIAENMRVAYNDGLREFVPWLTESPVGAEGPLDPNVLRVMWPSAGIFPIFGLPYTEPATSPSGPRIHLRSADWDEASTHRHELAHALHFSKLSDETRGRAQHEYVNWLLSEGSQGELGGHSFSEQTIPLVAFIEAFGCFGEMYPQVPVVTGDHPQDFFLEVNSLRDPFDGDENCGPEGVDGTVKGGDVEGAVFLALFFEFAKHPAVGLPLVVETIIECESLTVYEYASCIQGSFGLESDEYQALDLAGARYGIDFDHQVEIPDRMETGDRFGEVSVAGDFNGDGFLDLAVSAPGEGTGSTTGAGAVHILFGSSLALVTAQNQYFRAADFDVPGLAQGDDRFGAALAAGDFDADRFDDLAIGVPGKSVNGSPGAGSVVVLYGSAAGLETSRAQNWHQDAPDIVDASEPGDGFGSALAAGDFDADGFCDLAIGAPGEDLSIRSFVAIRGKGLSTPSARSRPVLPITSVTRIPSADARRGPALPITSESRIPRAGRRPSLLTTRWTHIPDAGAVTVLYGGSILKSNGLSGAGSDFWNQSLPNLLETAEPGDRFGSVLAAGNFNGDLAGMVDVDDLAIGVPLEDIGSIENAGVVQVLYGQYPSGLTDADTSVWHQNTEGVEDHAEANDFFGSALAAGNFTAGTAKDLAIGVPGEDVDVPDPSARPGRSSRPPLEGERVSNPLRRLPIRRMETGIRTVIDAGAVNVLQGTEEGGITSASDTFVTENGWNSHSDPETGDHFGAALAAGDFDNDGDDDLAIGVPNQDVGDDAEGAGAVDVIFSDVYVPGVLDVVGTGLTSAGNRQLHELSPYVGDHPAAGDRFGTSITVGNFNGGSRHSDLAIGVPHESEDGHFSAGALHVMPAFELPELEHQPLGDYEAMDPERRDDFDEERFSAIQVFGYLPQYWHQDR